MESANVAVVRRAPWNKGKLTRQKPPLKLREIWAIRMRLQMASNTGNSRCSISQLIASFERAISRDCRYSTSITEAT